MHPQVTGTKHIKCFKSAEPITTKERVRVPGRGVNRSCCSLRATECYVNEGAVAEDKAAIEQCRSGLQVSVWPRTFEYGIEGEVTRVAS